MNRVTTKQKRNATGEWGKHPRPFLKKLGNAKLRAEPTELPEFAKHKKKTTLKKFKQAKLCPFCLAHIPSQYKDNQFQQLGSCKNCKAVKQGVCMCSKCKSKDVWKQGEEFMCKQCGLKWHVENS